MRLYTPWNNCQRCDRAEYRWGIFAPSTRSARVLVLTAAASRSSQCIGSADPLPARIADRIAGMYRVAPSEIHVDTLLACGASGDMQAHEAAACAQRIEDQAALGPWPVALVVLVGDRAARLARFAGLLTAAGFLIGGQLRPFVVVQEEHEVGIAPPWSALGMPRRSPSSWRLYPAARALLVSLIAGTCTGHAWRPLGGEWRRSYLAPSADLVDTHLEGRGWLSPYRPVGFWHYCVVDVDLHNAVQYAQYNKTCATLKKLFPKSLFFTSSPTGGAHIYVRLPVETTYADAAVWLTEFLQMRDLLFAGAAPGPSATVKGTVASRLVEVPLHPPRLPFGLGSMLRGSPDPAKAVARFERWLEARDSSDFDAARAAVAGQKKTATTRWPERARWARVYVHERELEALGSRNKKKRLPLGDPWQPYLARLAPSVAVLATNGCLAFGTRTGTMTRLADALTEMVEPSQARALLRYWVEHRDHHSEDIHVAKDEVLGFADRLIDEVYEGQGIPTRTWALAEAVVKKVYADIAAGIAAPLGLTEEECRRAAFYILELFYMAGRGNIIISAEQFGLALQHDNIGGLPVRRPNQARAKGVGAAMRRLFLMQTRVPSHLDEKAGEYELISPFWPPPSSGGPVTYQVT